MNDENWKEEYKQWKQGLKSFQIKLLEDGAQSQNQQWLINDMWCEWKDLAIKRELNKIANPTFIADDPWEEKGSEANYTSSTIKNNEFSFKIN